MNLKKILEEFKDFFDKAGKMPIIATPFDAKDKNDLRRINGSVRFIVDYNRKKMYVFPAGILHYMVAEKIGFGRDMRNNDENYYRGIGGMKNGKISLSGSEYESKDEVEEKKLLSTGWLKKCVEK